MQERPLHCSEECRVQHDQIRKHMDYLQSMATDSRNRLQTLQTPWWKRVWFVIDGWPWYDLNGTQRRRPWHRHR